jgi:hypothetical protein
MNMAFRLSAAMLLPCLAFFGTARADVFETIDRVDAHGAVATGHAAIKMRFDEGLAARLKPPASDSYSTGVIGNGFQSCARAVNGHLMCLDGDDVKVFVPGSEATSSPYIPPSHNMSTLFGCSTGLRLATKRTNLCTAIATDDDGNFWLAGRKGQTHSVFKVVPAGESGACAARFLPVTGNAQYCFAEFSSGRPPLADMFYVGGEMGSKFRGPEDQAGPGLLLLEDRKTVTFLPNLALPPLQPLTRLPPVASGTGWGIPRNGEQIQGVAALALNPSNVTASSIYVVVTTSLGRVMAKRSDGSGDGFEVFNALQDRDDPSVDYAQCNNDVGQQFGIRVNAETRYAYVSDRDCRLVRALVWRTSHNSANPSSCAGSGPFWMCNAREAIPGTSPATYRDVTLSTGTVAPEGIAVGVGTRVSLADCEIDETCAVAPGIEMSNVQLEPNGKTGITVFPSIGIPDCREEPHRPVGDPSLYTREQRLCADAAAIKIINQREYLDISRLLPQQVQDEKFTDALTGQLVTVGSREMLISPMYRAQAFSDPTKHRKFEAVFGLTEDGVIFRRNFDLLFDVTNITEVSQGCGESVRGAPDFAWDLILTVSERYASASSMVAPLRRVDILGNTDCYNPTAVSGTRWSVYIYNAELKYQGLPDNAFRPNRTTMPKPAAGADAFADLLAVLFMDLGAALNQTAVADVDNNGAAPIAPPLSTELAGTYNNALDKLGKCISAAYYKQSSPNQNCNAFVSQIQNYKMLLAAAAPNGLDRANRVGEQSGRCDVMLHVLADHFLPSIPATGFYNMDPPPGGG